MDGVSLGVESSADEVPLHDTCPTEQGAHLARESSPPPQAKSWNNTAQLLFDPAA